MWTTLALILTVLMGGFIAYNGDLIGRKFGKRRVTLFHLRPKHTAILITSVTGVLISAFTTAIAFLLVPQVRDVIMHGEDAIKERKVLLKQRIVLKRDVSDLNAERQRLSGQLEPLRKKFAEVNLKLDAAKGQLDL